MEVNPPPARLARIADMIRQQLQLMQTCRLAKVARQTDPILDRLERIARSRAAQEKAIARNWPAATRRMANQTAGALRDLPHYVADAQRGIQTSLTPVPALRDLYDELVQLRQEFSAISCSCKNPYLSVTTEPIELHGIYLGEFEIGLDIGRLARESGSETFIVRALDPHPAASNRSITHPHVSDESICPGDASVTIRSALCSGRVCDAFLLMRSVLTGYNPDSPHVNIENWGGKQCYGCGYAVSESDAYWCNSCENDFCDECSAYCHRCNENVCEGCARTCPVCEETACRSCMTVCQDCGEPVCLNCAEEDQCPCHDETNQQENDTNEQDKTYPGAIIAAGAGAARP